MNETELAADIVDVELEKPKWAEIVPILIDGRIPMMGQWRPPGEWWTLGMANATKIEEKKKCVTNWIRIKYIDIEPTTADIEQKLSFLRYDLKAISENRILSLSRQRLIKLVDKEIQKLESEKFRNP